MLKSFLKADVVISTITFFGALYLLLETRTFGSLDAYGKLGPDYWPKFVLVTIMALSLGVVVNTLKGVSKGTIEASKKIRFDKGTLRFCLAFSLIAGYLILLPYVGFLVLTPIMMISFMILLGEKSKTILCTLPIVLTVGVVLLFTKVMYVPLPRGAGIFLDISHLLY